MNKILTKYKFLFFIPVITIIILLGYFIYFNALTLDDNHKHTYSKSDLHTLTPEEEPVSPEDGVNTKGYHIHINLDNMQMYVYKDGLFIKSYPCSGGKTVTPSPTGNWKVIDKGEWGDGFGGAWLGLDVPWGKLVLEYYT